MVDRSSPVTEQYRKAKHVEQNPDSKTWTASIDALRSYQSQDEQWHLSAIEFHHKVKEEAEALRDTVFALLTARSSAGTDSLREEIGKALYVRNHGPNPDWPIGVDKLGYQQEPYVKHVPAWEWFHGGDADAVLSVIHGAAQPSDMREALIRVAASLAAAISILERTPSAKKAAPSNTMFEMMLSDYRKALEFGRTALAMTSTDRQNMVASEPSPEKIDPKPEPLL